MLCYGQRQDGGASWDYDYDKSKYLAKAINRLVKSGKSFTGKDLHHLVKQIKDELR
jgi:hypothetical protein